VQQHSAHRLRLQDILAEIQLQVTPELWQKIKEKINSFREAKRTTGGAGEQYEILLFPLACFLYCPAKS